VSAEYVLTIQQTVSAELAYRLSWSHFERLMRVEDVKARDWYMKEASEQMWSVRTLDRNINTQYYERMLLSQVKEPVEQEMKEKTADFQRDKLEFIKNPTVLEFLGLPGNKGYKEKDLEQAILDNLSDFLMEMGKGFAFVARQQLIRTETEDYYIDLVFYNYLLKAFVLVDLKVGKISHQDVGQMDMYVRMYDELKRSEGDNPTIGILLCAQTDRDIARYSVLKGNEQIFASKYKLLLPSEEELANEISRQKEIFQLQFQK
jgi:predicted nuclease of restriction endonuclease-like (RecB) superfamily